MPDKYELSRAEYESYMRLVSHLHQQRDRLQRALSSLAGPYTAVGANGSRDAWPNAGAGGKPVPRIEKRVPPRRIIDEFQEPFEGQFHWVKGTVASNYTIGLRGFPRN